MVQCVINWYNVVEPRYIFIRSSLALEGAAALVASPVVSFPFRGQPIQYAINASSIWWFHVSWCFKFHSCRGVHPSSSQGPFLMVTAAVKAFTQLLQGEARRCVQSLKYSQWTISTHTVLNIICNTNIIGEITKMKHDETVDEIRLYSECLQRRSLGWWPREVEFIINSWTQCRRYPRCLQEVLNGFTSPQAGADAARVLRLSEWQSDSLSSKWRNCQKVWWNMIRQRCSWR